MQEKNKYILVLGSKPHSIIPKANISHIYAANGAAELASSLVNINSDIHFTSVVGGLEFMKNLNVQRRVLDSNPDRLICRCRNIDVQKFNFSKKMKYEFFSNKNQLMFQSNFFKLGILDLILKEMNYEEKILSKCKHLLKIITGKSIPITGVSTGFFAILTALKDHPDKQIIISGIGMSGGGHFYKVNTDEYTKRSRVDRGLILNLKNTFKTKLFTTDEFLAPNGQIKIWRS